MVLAQQLRSRALAGRYPQEEARSVAAVVAADLVVETKRDYRMTAGVAVVIVAEVGEGSFAQADSRSEEERIGAAIAYSKEEEDRTVLVLAEEEARSAVAVRGLSHISRGVEV